MPNGIFGDFTDKFKEFSDTINNRSSEKVLQDEYDSQMAMYNSLINGLTGKPGGEKLLPQIQQQHQQWLTDWQKRSGQQQQTTLTDQQTEQQNNANTGYDQILAQAQKAYSPDSIQQYYDVAQGNLNRAAGTAGSLASRTAGANSSNMLNPSGFIMSQLSQSQAPYAAQAGNLQATAAQAKQSGAEGLTNLLYTLQRAKQGDTTAAQQLQYQYAALQQNQNQYQQSLANNQYQFNQNMALNEASPLDTIFGLAGTAANLYGSGIFGGTSKKNSYGFQYGGG